MYLEDKTPTQRVGWGDKTKGLLNYSETVDFKNLCDYQTRQFLKIGFVNIHPNKK